MRQIWRSPVEDHDRAASLALQALTSRVNRYDYVQKTLVKIQDILTQTLLS